MSALGYAEVAWLGGEDVASGVVLTTSGDRITEVVTGIPAAPPGARPLTGLTVPGLVNVHSHAFHRALRGRTQEGRGTFWTWREQMYAVAGRLTPESYRRLAAATYAEMALAGITCVGEFHYLHHRPDGTPYARPNAMGEALVDAAADAGIRLTLLDTCYLAGGIDRPLEGPQVRFGDGSARRWAERASRLESGPTVRTGAAIHSVRAVPVDEMRAVADWANRRAVPLHVHLSEQEAENAECLAATGCTPTALLSRAGALGPRTVAVHATHLTAADVRLLGGSGTGVCMCPTTERDLADGIGPARDLAAAGSPLSLGSDSHAVIDIVEEARGLELDERLRTRERGHWTAAELLRAATDDGARALGWPELGRLEVGALADFVSIDLRSVRTAGTLPESALAGVVFAAGAADVRDLVVGGRLIVDGGRHTTIHDVPGALAAAVREATEGVAS